MRSIAVCVHVVEPADRYKHLVLLLLIAFIVITLNAFIWCRKPILHNIKRLQALAAAQQYCIIQSYCRDWGHVFYVTKLNILH